MQEAMLYEKLSDNKVRCNLCAHHCVIADGRRGVCRVRENRGGVLYTLVFGRTIAQHVDPVEKKPLYHFYPGSSAFSIATPGCNFRCQWCQNWQISQIPSERDLEFGRESSPEEIVASAEEMDCRSIAYTYTEPTVFFEYALQIAGLASRRGIANIYVTNGYMSQEMLDLFQPYLNAANVDLKAFRNETYRRYVGAGLRPVLDNMIYMKRLGIWLEVTTLVIPGINDDSDELRDAARFIVHELGPDTPWHISRFFPGYKMTDRPPTPIPTLYRAQEIGLQEGLHFVYVGNVDGEAVTVCPQCLRPLIIRNGFQVVENHLRAGKCPYCGASIAGVWSDQGSDELNR